MNALVSYDSSSGDDESALDPNNSRSNNSRSYEDSINVNGLKTSSAPVLGSTSDAPLIGPSAAPANAIDYEEYNDDPTLESSMSERDLVRHLTQATHPMSEMPPSPPRSPDAATQARIRRFLDLKAKGSHFNEDLAAKSAFKNPSLLYNLLDRMDVDREAIYRTSMPLDVLDTSNVPSFAYKEELLKAQQAIRSKQEVNKRNLSATGKRTMDFVSNGHESGSNTASPSGLQKRQK